MRILLLRHGETAGNLEKRYVGRTNEGLTEAAIQALRQTSEKRKQLLYGLLGPVAAVYASPMRRCLETAALVFPEKDFSGVPVRLVPGLSECDFGRFEYKNYRELSGDADYQRFIDSGGTDGFPGGEAVAQFSFYPPIFSGDVLSVPMNEVWPLLVTAIPLGIYNLSLIHI